MGNNPMVSVIMPCYNHEKYVADAIESVLNQTYQNVKLTVLDNGSTDGSLEVIKKYEDRINIIIYEKNDQKKSTEELFGIMEGDYLAYISSDDYWYPDKIEKQIQYMEENNDCGICFTWAEITDENLDIIVNKEQFRRENRSRGEWLRSFVEHGTSLEVSSLFMRNQKEIKSCFYADCFRFYQYVDLRQLIQVAFVTEINVIQEYLVKHRLHSGSVGDIQEEGTQERSHTELLHILKELWEEMPDELFLEGYHDELIDPNVKGKDEIVCEKILVFFKQVSKNIFLGQSALEYMWKNIKDDNVREILENKYRFTRDTVKEYSKVIGVGSLISGMKNRVSYLEDKLIQHHMAKEILYPESIELMKSIVQCNEILQDQIRWNDNETELLVLVQSSLEAIKGIWQDLKRTGVGLSDKELKYAQTAYERLVSSAISSTGWGVLVIFLADISRQIKDILE